MNTKNYQTEMEKIISYHMKKSEKPKLLLHSCCAPCSTACIERVSEFFDLTVYYYNPNIDTESEYSHRANEQQRLCTELNVKCIIEEYAKQDFLTAVQGLEREKEGGTRCDKCFYLRLNKTAQTAKENGFDYFATTLSVSPLKNIEKLNEAGQKAQEQTGVKFLPTDFKKKGGYLRSIELSKRFNLYRQNYCGCEFSLRGEPNKN